MKCPVCHATFDDRQSCPQCGNHPQEFQGSDVSKLLEARERFKDKAQAFDPDARVRPFDKWKPWLAVLLGFAIFLAWLRACSTILG